ncbi:MAG TPA: tRNA 2-selenouridine(34) synthase MnmH [Spirochaetota bacterium]|nr:tRNA 2-selenouridine(34) synthase MnmH [Spirochaetota bacterium]HPI88671.1 tRNA 2-selenouridine(34) synthase MnmH [Spirochaetota bacterium]HPR49112.1 tRNA 2-selenouridine(34) synthase MnmH [Spirochaetota bacterium]
MKMITYTESRGLTDPLYVDVRSPSEYAHDHIPGALNIPIFTDDERREIGTLYRHSGRDEAIVRGTEMGGRKIASIIAEISNYQGRQIVIYCARGGMRSGSVASLISSLGFEVYRLDRGYKGYRHQVLRSLECSDPWPRLIVLQGLTGSGKTEILTRIGPGIDLEGMAGHRSSLFGAIGLKQNSQKMFDSLLASRLDELGNEPFAIIEGESKKIGNCHIPETLYDAMKKSPVIYIDTPMERRIDILIREYTKVRDDEKVISIVKSLRSKLSEKTVAKMIELFTGGDLKAFVELLLLKYYDPLYRYSISRLDFIGTVTNYDSDTAAKQVMEIAENFI